MNPTSVKLHIMTSS